MDLGIRSRYLLIHVRFLALVYVSSAKSEHRFTQPLVRPFEGPKLHPRIAPTHPTLGRPTRHLNYSSSLSSVSTRLHPPSLLPAHPLSLCSSSTWSIPIPHTSSYVDPPSPHSLKTFCLLKLNCRPHRPLLLILLLSCSGPSHRAVPLQVWPPGGRPHEGRVHGERRRPANQVGKLGVQGVSC